MPALGFDIGSFSCYVAASRTKGIDTIDNDYSERCTPCYVSFSGLRRYCGISARDLQITNIHGTASGFKNLIGLTFSDPAAKYEMKMNPQLVFVELPEDDIGIKLKYNGKESIFTPIQLYSMIFGFLKKIASNDLKTEIKEIVINCPVYFGISQRNALLMAASIANLKVQTILNDTAAVAITYGLYNVASLTAQNSPERLVALVDVGYSSCQISICKFQGLKIKILAENGSPFSCGGRFIDFKIVEMFCAQFKARYNLDVQPGSKQWLKLAKECANLKKKVNSSNVALPFGIECFMNDIDVNGKLSKEEIHEMSHDMLTQIKELFEKTLKQAGLDSSDQLHSIEIVGGGSRLFSVKTLLMQLIKREINNTLNCDEAVARGCALLSARLSPTISIKQFEYSDMVNRDVRAQIYVDKQLIESINVFTQCKLAPCTCLVSVNVNKDFTVILEQVRMDGTFEPVSQWLVKGIPVEFEKGKPEPKIKLKIRYNESGIAHVIQALMIESVDDPIDATPNSEELQQQESEKPQQQSQQQQPKTRVVNISHNLVPLKRLDTKTLNDYVSMENKIREIDELEIKRCDNLNALESLLYNLKNKMEGSWREYASEDEYKDIMSKIRAEQEKLEESYDHQTEYLVKKYEEYNVLTKPVSDRYSMREKYKTFISATNDGVKFYEDLYLKALDPTFNKYKHIPVEKLEVMGISIGEMKNMYLMGMNFLRDVPCHTPEFPVNLTDYETRLKNLCKACQEIINIPIPEVDATPQPPPPEVSESSISPNGTQEELKKPENNST